MGRRRRSGGIKKGGSRTAGARIAERDARKAAERKLDKRRAGNAQAAPSGKPGVKPSALGQKQPPVRVDPHSPERGGRVKSRALQGREKVVGASLDLPFVLSLSLDVVARFRGTGSPLARLVSEMGKRRRLGPRERTALGDLVFAWARHHPSLEKAMDAHLKEVGGLTPSRRDRDLAIMWLSAHRAQVAVGDKRPALTRVMSAFLDAQDIAAPAGLERAPAWFGEQLVKRYGDGAAAVLDALLTQSTPVLAVDTKHVAVDEVLTALTKLDRIANVSPLVPDGVRVSKHFPLGGLPPRVRAHVWPMDDGSQLVARALGAQPGERVLDLCAGGGGKSVRLSTDGCDVVAADIDPVRLDGARARLGKGALTAVQADGTAAPFKPASFDRVLVDAPCSGSGTLRHAPDVLGRLGPDHVARHVGVQTGLLNAALDLVKPGGVVVYATCSVLADENDDVLDAVLGARKDTVETPLAGLLGHVPDAIDAAQTRVQLLPNVHGCDGFFIAALKKAG